MARIVEQLTAMLIGINVRYKAHSGHPHHRPARRGAGLMAAPVVVLAGGTGGAKLARGMLDVVGDDLVVIANTGDDVEIYGAHVSPDPDLVTFWLADRIDDRGWGLRDDTFNVMDGLRELGVDVWFNLGDRDLAIGLQRAQRLAQGARLTETLAELGACAGPARARAADGRRAGPHVGHGRRALGGISGVHDPRRARPGPIDGVELRGVEAATATPEVLEAIAGARAIVIGPSNPVISIGPILAVPGLRDALRAARRRSSPSRRSSAARCSRGRRRRSWPGPDIRSVPPASLRHYGDLLDGIVCDDEDALDVPSLRIDTSMADADARRRVAAAVLEFALGLAA